MIKVYFKFAGMALISLLFNAFVYITSPLWALIAAAFNINQLPGILRWVHTHDNDIYGQPDMPPAPTNFKERFKTAVWWLCRNPGYGFDVELLGFPETAITHQETIKQYGQFDSGESAMRHDIIIANDKTYFSYRRDFKLGNSRFIKTWFGWNYGSRAGQRMLKIDFNPFKKKR